MRKILLFGAACLLATSVVFAQTEACGPEDFKGRVEATKDQGLRAVDKSKATLVFIEDQLVARPGAAMCIHCDVPVLLAMDGRWIAGTQGFAHTIVTIEPGEHHFCSKVFLGGKYLPSMFEMKLESGMTYYLVARLSIAIASKSDILELYQPNIDQGRYLASVTKETSLVQK
jgi:hypothetical protein